ncbi:MAG: polyketide synthase dehydratase domain-containing protein [Desulforhopalus sp.]
MPAVETMLLLAAKVREICPEIDIRVMEDVRFAKFLEIPPEVATLEGFVEFVKVSDGRVQVKLLSRTQFKAISRMKEHGEIIFPSAHSVDADPHPARIVYSPKSTGPVSEISADYIYRELVPFGANYQTLQETLFLSGYEAWGIVKAPELHKDFDSVQEIIGSPFPLDGAFHAACVLGQQFVDFVPFPVGFARRVISLPTQPGCCYSTRVILTSRTSDELVFDLVLFDEEGRIYETLTGLCMRNVIGKMKK